MLAQTVQAGRRESGVGARRLSCRRESGASAPGTTQSLFYIKLDLPQANILYRQLRRVACWRTQFKQSHGIGSWRSRNKLKFVLHNNLKFVLHKAGFGAGKYPLLFYKRHRILVSHPTFWSIIACESIHTGDPLHRLKNKLLNLAVGEFAAALTFIILYTVLDARKIGNANWVAFLFLIFILIQGSFYWFYRYFTLLKPAKSELIAIKLFRSLKWLNLVLLMFIAGIIPFIMNDLRDLMIAIMIFLFGVIEYINYYWYRLSYGKSGFNIRMLINSGLQKSNLNKWINSE